MSQPILERSRTDDTQHSGGCPFHADLTETPELAELSQDDWLFLPMHKRTIAQYVTNETGATELRLYYEDKEISFDEPELFAFGENLAKQASFPAISATGWGQGYDWPVVKDLLEELILQGILQTTNPAPAPKMAQTGANHLLPTAPGQSPRTWFECEAIMAELTGRPVELGYLELMIPVFRVAHIAMDNEGRQVGESNVFPKPLRVEVSTEWTTCPYPGSRYQNERPMNLTALKSMGQHWLPAMAALLQIREAYLRRFPEARAGWTVGHLERLSALVLAVPAYQLMKTAPRVANGELHPVLSSMYRVTDGVRMTTHQMLFLPVVETTLAPDAPMTAQGIYDYAERNYVFQSAHGVCAGPRKMIEEFLGVLVDGTTLAGMDDVPQAPEVAAALDALPAALDYGLYGLQAHAIAFSVWPLMSRHYEELWTILDTWPNVDSERFNAFKALVQTQIKQLQSKSLIASEAWRADREKVYADMYQKTCEGLGLTANADSLAERIAPPALSAYHRIAEAQLRGILSTQFGRPAYEAAAFERLIRCLMKYFRREQGILAAAEQTQQAINRLLGRPQPEREFSAADLNIYNLLLGEVQRIPHIGEVFEQLFHVEIRVTKSNIDIREHG
ncbi:hypothetical protein ACQE3E_06790 [Methylomonas sp. MED-D]|uniref:hypothetical protein n=1 Tax=Methylomonas sp. MED-D TaxID=3418768 RepID=UPI003CFFF5ED